jgi:tRNA G18 (ribose-2'-O)-methylase SpoU
MPNTAEVLLCIFRKRFVEISYTKKQNRIGFGYFALKALYCFIIGVSVSLVALFIMWKHFASTDEAVDELKRDGYSVIAIEQAEKAVMLNDFNPADYEKYAFVFGNEVEGVSQQVIDVCNNVIEIPQFGTKHSLNIAVSAGVVIWDVFSKLKLH